MQNTLVIWLQSLKHYILMCLLLSSPERLPYNTNAIMLTLASYFMIATVLVDETRGYSAVFAQIMLELSMLALIAYFMLRWKKLLPRFQQTFSALVGINVIITAVSIPLYQASTSYQAEANTTLFYITLAIMIWNLAVLSWIFKRAFEISIHLSAMISFNYFVLYQFIVFWFYS